MFHVQIPPALGALFMSVLSVGCEIVPFLKKEPIVNLMVEIHPHLSGLRGVQAFEHWQRGDIEGARQHFEEATHRHGDDLSLRAMQCLFLFKTGDPSWEEVLRRIESAGPSGSTRALIETVAAEAGIELGQLGNAAVDRSAFAGAEILTRISA